ncbi:MAG: pilin [Patescibacteria group bacterium]
MQKTKIITMVLLLGLFLPTAIFATAQKIEIKDGGGKLLTTGVTNNKTALGMENSASVPDIVANVIKFVMAIVGMVMLVLTVYAGVLWMTAGGSVENIEKAKKLLKNAVIGLILIMAAYTVTDFAVVNIVKLTSVN